MKGKRKTTKRKKQSKIMDSSVGLVKLDTEENFEYSFRTFDIFRLLLLFTVFSIPFIFWNNLIIGLGIGLLHSRIVIMR